MKLRNKDYKDVNFRQLDKMDTDGDKVMDNLDKCPETPAGVKVDKNGCPIDTDKDGVPDYLDKEPNTPLSSVVDENGVALTPKMVEEQYVKDSLIMAGLLTVDKDSTMTVSMVTDSMLQSQKIAYYKSIQPNSNNDNKINPINTNDINNGNVNTNNNTNTNNTTNNGNLNEQNAPIAGVIYRVQIGSLNTADSRSYFQKTFKVTEEIHVDSYQGAYKYSVGTFYTYASARQYANSLKTKNGINSFVISYKDGIRIPVSDAKVITGQ
jgi:hypothetical protein